VQPGRDAVAKFGEALAFPGLGAGAIDLEDLDAGGQLGLALGEGVQAGAEDDVLGDAVRGLLGYQVLGETRAGQDARAVAAGAAIFPEPAAPGNAELSQEACASPRPQDAERLRRQHGIT
jgi:hypothetical protein